MAESNWLATLGAWLTKPFKVILGPWKQKLIDERIDSIALKYKLIEAIVKLRLLDYKKVLSKELDDDRLNGLAMKITEQLKKKIDEDQKIDPSSMEFLKVIESEITLQVVPIEDWLKLLCLQKEGLFTPQGHLAIEFSNKNGTSRSMKYIRTMGGTFAFIKPFGVDEQTLSWRLSDESKALLTDYCQRNKTPEVKYDIHLNPDPMQYMSYSTFQKVLPKEWKPQEV